MRDKEGGDYLRNYWVVNCPLIHSFASHSYREYTMYHVLRIYKQESAKKPSFEYLQQTELVTNWIQNKLSSSIYNELTS